MIRRSARLQGAMVLFGTLSLTGCVGQAVVGDEEPGSEELAGDGDGDESVEPLDCTGAAANQPPSPTPVPNAFSNLAGTVWEGYYEGGDDVTLILGADGTGSFYVGEKLEFAPPTDPDVGYLCHGNLEVMDNCYDSYLVRTGYEYSVEGAEVSNRRLQFQVVLSEPWDDWCGLQTPQRLRDNCAYGTHPLQNAAGQYAPESGCYLGSVDDPDREQVDCDWFLLTSYSSPCTCNAQECFGNRDMKPIELTANEEFTELSNLDGLRLFLAE